MVNNNQWQILLFMFLFLGLAAMAPITQANTAYDFEFETIDGDALPLSDYRGKVILLVNTASKCGFTPQYTALQSLWQEYRGQGLVVLGIPSNDFGGQEPGSSAEIKTFCEVNFNIDFPMTSKTIVKGRNAHAFYQWAGTQLGWLAKPKWNFHKYLIDRNGNLHGWYSSMTSPDSSEFRQQINTLLSSTN